LADARLLAHDDDAEMAELAHPAPVGVPPG
jgi:hypothetical protein